MHRHTSVKSGMAKRRRDKSLPIDLIQRFAHEGLSERAIVKKLATRRIITSRSTVHRRLQSIQAASSVPAKSLKNPRRKLPDSVKRYLVRLIRFHGKHTTAALRQELQVLGYVVSKQTVIRTLRSIPTLALKAPRQRMAITKDQKAARLQWARSALAQRINWSLAFFADEKIWNLDGPDSRSKVWYDKRDPPPKLNRTGAQNKAVSVWGAFSLNAVPQIARVPTHLNSGQYCDVIRDQLLTVRPSRRYTMYHDRLTAHHSAQTNAWMSDRGLKVQLFPPKAADINPMENVWGILTKRVFTGTKTFTNEESLYAAIEAAWATIRADRGLRERLVNSMTGRLQQVIKRKGDWADF